MKNELIDNYLKAKRELEEWKLSNLKQGDKVSVNWHGLVFNGTVRLTPCYPSHISIVHGNGLSYVSPLEFVELLTKKGNEPWF